MKRFLLIAVLMIVAISVTFGQIAYNKGEQVASLSLGLGSTVAISGATGGTPPIVVNYDYGYNENISFGGLFGYTTSTWSDAYVDAKYTDIIIGVRGAYHLDVLHNDKVDTYGGIMLAYDAQSASVTSSLGYAAAGASSGIKAGFFLGGRYFFNPNWTGQVELGYDIAYFKIGIGYKF